MNSKPIATIAALLSPFSVLAQGSLTLNAGETYTFEFSTLPLIGPTTPGLPFNTFGSLSGIFSPSLQPGSAILFEMFEGSVAETATGSQTLSAPVGLPAPPGPFMFVDGAWQDLQGAVRISMLSGSATLSIAKASVVRDEAGGLFEYSSSVLPVPEPSPFVLIGAGSIALCLMNQDRKGRKDTQS
jgi:hypothetical protein